MQELSHYQNKKLPFRLLKRTQKQTTIEAKTECIIVNGSYDYYTISVSKEGYITKIITLSKADLRTYSNTPLIFLLTNIPVTDCEGNEYNIITIGTQTWIAENLKTTKYNDCTDILNVTDKTAWSNLTTPAYCWYNNDYSNYGTIYGALYNWYTIDPATNVGKNIAPKGWHVPTDAEWRILTDYMGGNYPVGDRLKESGLTHWKYSPYDTGANNASGFTALGGGFRWSESVNIGIDVGLGLNEMFWSSTPNDATSALLLSLHYNYSFVYSPSFINSNNKKFGNPIRCVKDNN
jgi:uncharacterized protein (TIGR02145 family)